MPDEHHVRGGFMKLNTMELAGSGSVQTTCANIGVTAQVRSRASDASKPRPRADRRQHMFRKLIIIAAATAALGSAALIPTTASAYWGGWHGGWHRHFWG